VADILQGEIYHWAAIPPEHPMASKPHMWVVVSSSLFNKAHDHVMACPLTSHPATRVDVHVPDTPQDPLTHDSSLRVSMMSPILRNQLSKPIGRLSFKIVRQVIERLRIIVEAK
jgi:mRNA-degrading endonuclease toxin of MazEF toxin-antitoxin module